MKSVPPTARLVRHLVAIVVVKLALLTALWWAFFRDARVDVTADDAARQVLLRAPADDAGRAPQPTSACANARTSAAADCPERPQALGRNAQSRR